MKIRSQIEVQTEHAGKIAQKYIPSKLFRSDINSI
jgi:hypothetical protein